MSEECGRPGRRTRPSSLIYMFPTPCREARREESRLDETRQQLRALDDARAGAVEVGVAVDTVRAPIADGGQRLPFGSRRELRQLAPGLLEREATWHQNHDIRMRRD